MIEKVCLWVGGDGRRVNYESKCGNDNGSV